MNKYLRVIIIISILLLIAFITLIFINSDRFKALERLKKINKESLEKYFQSYDKIFNDQTMVSTLDDFNKGKPPATFSIPEIDHKPSEYTADCYSILMDLCALGNLKKMYIPRCIDNSKSLQQNQTLYEQQVGRNLKVGKDSRILEIGSGCGRIAYDMSKFTGADVYGINIDSEQIKDAKKFIKKKKTNKLHFVFSDLNDIQPFEDNFFDGIYEFGAFVTFITNFESVFKEMFRILKPGGIFFISDAVLLDDFRRDNKEHLELLKNSRMVMAGGVFVHYKYIEKYAKDAGFNILLSKGGEFPNLAQDLPMLIKEHANFNKIEKIIKFVSKIKLLPSYMPYLMKRLRFGGDELVKLEENNLLTMDWDFYLQKPF